MAARATSSTSSSDVTARAAHVLAWLARRGRRANVEAMARYGIPSARAYGVSMATMRPLVRRLGRDHALAETLWASGWLEARVVAGVIADPAACSDARRELTRPAVVTRVRARTARPSGVTRRRSPRR